MYWRSAERRTSVGSGPVYILREGGQMSQKILGACWLHCILKDIVCGCTAGGDEGGKSRKTKHKDVRKNWKTRWPLQVTLPTRAWGQRGSSLDQLQWQRSLPLPPHPSGHLQSWVSFAHTLSSAFSLCCTLPEASLSPQPGGPWSHILTRGSLSLVQGDLAEIPW